MSLEKGVYKGGTHVEVNNLGQERSNNENQQHIQKPLVELRLSSRLGDDGGSQALRRHNAQSADPTADGNVHHHILGTILWPQPKCDNSAADDNDARIAQKQRMYDEALHVLDVLNSRCLWCIHDDDNRPNDTQKTSNLADHAQALLQENGRQDGGDDDRQGSQRGDQNGIGEGVRSEIESLAQDHQDHARPPVKVLEIPISLASHLVVLFVGAKQADLFEHEGGTDEGAGANGKAYADRLEHGGSLGGGWPGAAAGADVELLHMVNRLCCMLHGVGCAGRWRNKRLDRR